MITQARRLVSQTVIENAARGFPGISVGDWGRMRAVCMCKCVCVNKYCRCSCTYLLVCLSRYTLSRRVDICVNAVSVRVHG